MTFYQLSRLHYCFANSKIHSNKGYPKWLFIIMFTIGVILLINWPIAVVFFGFFFFSNCGINAKLEFHYVPMDIVSFKYAFLWINATAGIYQIWDLVTLFLYYHKIRSIRKTIKNMEKNQVVFNRISSILYKIFILTMFYEILQFIAFILVIIAPFASHYWFETFARNTAFMISNIVFSVSMYLMMEHNKSEYVIFLKIIYKLRLHWICCKYGSVVVEQLDELLRNNNANKEKIQKNIEITEIDTYDHSVMQSPTPMNRQASLPTVTQEIKI